MPATDLVRGVVELDDHGYVVTHGYLETSVPGVYAAGDLRVKNLRQVVTATADGAIAAVELERYAKQLSEKTGLVPPRPTASAYEESEAAAAANSAASAAGTTPAPAPVKRSADAAAAASAAKKPGELFSAAIKQQLGVVFGRMTQPVTLALELDDTPLSAELQGFIGEMVALSNGKLNSVAVDAAGLITAVDGSDAPTSLVVGEPLAVVLSDGTELPTYGSLDDSGRAEFDVAGALPVARPAVRICVPGEDGSAGAGKLVFTGLAFHGVPSGHEFNSFVLGLYNAAGPGQPLDDDLSARAKAITDPLNIMILVSLTCTMCPETVLASQRIASLSPAVRAEAYDVSHFPELKDQYGAMSVPCIVVTHADGTQQVEFGKKSIPQMLTLIGA